MTLLYPNINSVFYYRLRKKEKKGFWRLTKTLLKWLTAKRGSLLPAATLSGLDRFGPVRRRRRPSSTRHTLAQIHTHITSMYSSLFLFNKFGLFSLNPFAK